MRVLGHLQPKRVFAHFEDICAIPHGSGNMERISAHCLDFAKGLGLECWRDELCNVIIKKPASPGYEDHPAVILQGHLDMVCEKEPGSAFDFATDGLELYVDGDWVKARGTTLGGDDGIAVAMAMAILEDDTLPHPPLEVVFTVDEEVGLDGAAGLDTSRLYGKRLLNMDSEEEGTLTVGCAGGARADIRLPLSLAPVEAPCYDIVVTGLAGGHSGAEIHKGRQNANILMGRLLHSLPAGWRLVSIAGGQKDNAIPRHTVATIATHTDPTGAAAAFLAANRIDTEPELTVTVTPATPVKQAVIDADSKAAAALLATVKNGLQAMSEATPDIPETSLNLGILKIEDGHLVCSFSVRSAIGAKKAALLADLKATATAFGAAYSDSAHYPAWEYRADSPLRDAMVEVYRRQYGEAPQVVTIHAGLECGLFSDKIPGLDAVSFGPNNVDIHTTEERMSIASVARTYAYLCGVLKAL